MKFINFVGSCGGITTQSTFVEMALITPRSTVGQFPTMLVVELVDDNRFDWGNGRDMYTLACA